MNNLSGKLRARYRYPVLLLRQLIKTDFKLRYQGSVLGYLWSLLRPMAIFAILYVVFTRYLKIGKDIPHYPVYLLLGIVLWNFFVEVTTGSVSIIVAKGDLIRKINFPKYVIILSGSFSALINLLLNLVVVVVFMIVNGVSVGPRALLFPIYIIELFIFSLAVAFFLSAAYVRWRDLSYVWEVVMQGAFYAVPIIYPMKEVTGLAAKFIIFNPIAQMIQDSRYILVTQQSQTIADIYGSPFIRLGPLAIVVVSVVIAAWYFRARSKYFAEEV